MDIEEFNRKAKEAKKTGIIKECFHHNKSECVGKIKQAHSIQRNGRLSIIESEVKGNMCVYTFTNFKSDEKTVITDLIPLGKKEASTFYGFCGYHDTNLFSPIENFKFDSESPKHWFLHSYRSFAHSYHKKKEELKYWNEIDNTSFGHLFQDGTKQLMTMGNEIALKELERAKKFLDDALDAEDFESLEYLVYEKEGLYPFAVSSQMSPKVSYKNQSINNHENPGVPYENPIITFLPDKESTIAIIAAFPYQSKAVNLIYELHDLNDLRLEKAITSLIIANCENTILSPTFWNKLSKKYQRKLLDEFIENTTTAKYDKNFFISEFNFFDSKFDISDT